MIDLLFLYAEAPVHAGAAESIRGIDLPIQREEGSGLPTIWGQSLKGALRETAAAFLREEERAEVFGSPPPTEAAADELQPGTLSVGDARLVAFPVPTLERTFAWATSALVLGRVARAAALANIDTPPVVTGVGVQGVTAAGGSWSNPLVVGEFPLAPEGEPARIAAWAAWLAERALPTKPALEYFRTKLREHLLLVEDGVLADLTVEHADVVARVQLENKTVKQGPWYEEHLPVETLLVAPLGWTVGVSDELRRRLKQELDNETFVVGGDQTVGKGVMWCRWIDSGNEGGAQ